MEKAESMNIFDWIIIVILGFFSIKSFIRGAAREIFSLLALLLAGFLAGSYYPLLIPSLQPYLAAGWAQNIVSFSAIFLTVCLAVNAAGWLLSKLLKKIHLRSLDKTAGAFVGAAKAYVIVCCIIIVMLLLPQENKLLKNSVLSSYGLPFVTFISRIFPDPIKGVIQEKSKKLSNMNGKKPGNKNKMLKNP